MAAKKLRDKELNMWHLECSHVVNIPVVAGAVLQAPLSLIHSLIINIVILFQKYLKTTLNPKP